MSNSNNVATIDSHVYLPKFILKKFANKNNNNINIIYNIDVKNNKINEEVGPNKFNVINGYFWNNNEKILNNQAENNMSNVIEYLEKKRKNKKIDFILSEEKQKEIKDYLAYVWLRSDCLNDIIKKRLNINCDINLLKNIMIENENKSPLVCDVTKDLAFRIIFNYTNKQFVTSSSNYTLMSDSEKYYIITLIVSPYIAISFFNKDSFHEYKTNINYYIQSINDENEILNHNKNSYNSALINYPNFVVGRKKELEELKKIYNK